MKKLNLLILLAFLLINTSLASNAKKTNPIKAEKSPTIEANEKDLKTTLKVKWTESLRLRDFYLHPSYLELRTKLKNYSEVTSQNYKKNPHVFSAAVEHGLLLIDTGEIDEASKVWNLALKDFPANDVPTVYSAWVKALNGDYIEAKNAWYPVIYEKMKLGVGGSGAALLWLPQHVDAVVGLQLIKDQLPEKDKEEVEKTVSEVIGTFARQPKFAALLISKDLQNGDLQSAAEKLTSSLPSSPEDPILITLLGITQLLSNYNDEALKLFNTALEVNPGIPTTQIMKARTLFATNKKKEAYSAIDLALKLDPSIQLVKKERKNFLSFPSFSVSLDTRNLEKSTN